MKKRVVSLFIIILLVILAGFAGVYFYRNYLPARTILQDSPAFLKDEPPLISHAAGGIWVEKKGGEKKLVTYSNSVEALRGSLKNGYKLIEIDLAYTTDGDFACTHAWPKSDTKYMSSWEWRNYLVKKKYTSMSLRFLLQILKNRPDVYLVTDNKSNHTIQNTRTEFQLLYEQAMAIGGTQLLDRIIPQFYNRDMYEVIEEIYDWPMKIFTLYRQNGVSDQEIIDFVKEKDDILIITMPKKRVSKKFCQAIHDIGKYAYTHTVDTREEMIRYRRMGIDGFYTNAILPEDYREKW